MDFMHVLANALPVYVIFLFSLCFHEFSHAAVSTMRGDTTAQMMGRLTLNPVSHSDLMGTVVFPLIGLMSPFPMIGWAKPVPVNERNLKHPKSDMFWIAFAGPLSNILLATIGIFGFHIYQKHIGGVEESAVTLVQAFVYTNLGLAVFNLIPVHPLDGGKVIARFIPDKWNRSLEDNMQMLSMVLLGLMLLGGLRFLYYPISWIFEGISLVATSVVG